MKDPILSGYHPVTLIYDKSEQNADICILTEPNNSEICLFDRHALSTKNIGYRDLQLLKEWLIDGL